jgi:hypothetical protein
LARGALIPALVAGALAASPAPGAADAFETWMGIDVDRHLWMTTGACRDEALIEAVPGVRRGGGFCARGPGAPASGEGDSPPRFSLEGSSSYRNLLRREPGSGGDSLSRIRHDDLTHALRLEGRPARLLRVRADLETSTPPFSRRDFREPSLGFSAEPSSPAWTARATLAVPILPWLVPAASAGTGSDGRHEAALGLSGDLAGFYWAFASGRQERDLPSRLLLEDYAPFDFPLQLRRTFHAASAEWRGRRLELSATARLTRDRHPGAPGAAYTGSDSGQSAEVIAGAAWSDSGAAGRWRAAVEGQRFEGRAVFRGLREREGGLYQFAYLETRARSAWLRAEVSLRRGAWEGGAFAGGGAVRWDAYRPEVPAGRFFWDRNAVIDSYQGGLVDLFSRETWLFDGRLGLGTRSAGAWAARSFGAWDLRSGAAWNHLDLEAHGRLTQRTSTLIVGTEERDAYLDFPGLEAHLLTPELSLARRFAEWGMRVEVSVAQALPLRLRLREDAGAGEGGGGDRALPSASDYSGGTRARLLAAWTLP